MSAHYLFEFCYAAVLRVFCSKAIHKKLDHVDFPNFYFQQGDGRLNFWIVCYWCGKTIFSVVKAAAEISKKSFRGATDL